MVRALSRCRVANHSPTFLFWEQDCLAHCHWLHSHASCRAIVFGRPKNFCNAALQAHRISAGAANHAALFAYWHRMGAAMLAALPSCKWLVLPGRSKRF